MPISKRRRILSSQRIENWSIWVFPSYRSKV